ncbi:hypothetical protein C7M84_006602 [Penaeus vannamei]|uniref:Saposin B-type domain-containing protein n=1 Tax=Penaeus vannamei TaxID=6689 RepID=A0A423TEJ3_PENVA|nr:hypothetical protein C7M84_006602 [Penaeus vannamei]
MEGRLARIVAVLAVVSCVWMVEGEKAAGPKTKVPDDKLFSDQPAFCEGCYAVVHELDSLLTKWKKETGSLEDHIDAALLAICSTDRLRSYVLSPPKMTRLCSGIRVHYLDDLGMAFMKKYAQKRDMTADEIFEATCRKIIPACPNGMKPMSVARKGSLSHGRDACKGRLLVQGSSSQAKVVTRMDVVACKGHRILQGTPAPVAVIVTSFGAKVIGSCKGRRHP